MNSQPHRFSPPPSIPSIALINLIDEEVVSWRVKQHPEFVGTQIEWQVANTPREYAKLSANERASIWIRQSKKGMPKMREQSRQQGAPRILTEVHYY